MFHVYCDAPPVSVFRPTSREAIRFAVARSRSNDAMGNSLLVCTHEVIGPGHMGGRTVCFVREGSIQKPQNMFKGN